MAQSLSKILLHIIFSTKDRAKLIPPEIEDELHAYIAGICRNLKSNAYKVGGTDNHVHIACSLPRTLTVSDLLEKMKSFSSKWIKLKSPQCTMFAWQAGYGVFSFGQTELPIIMKYIENQHEHHKKWSFEEELRELLKLYEIESDEHYLWD